MSTLISKGFYLIALLSLTGCVTAPTYVRPPIQVPASFRELQQDDLQKTDGWRTGQPKDDALRSEWWRIFGDAKLNDLESQVNGANQTLIAAAASYTAARQAVLEARSRVYPTLGAGSAITNLHLALPGAGGMPTGKTYTEYSLPISASWEPDFFGKVRNSVNAAVFSAQANAADLENTRLALHAELAADWFSLREQDSLIELFDATVAAYRETLDLNESLFRAGTGTDEAVSQAEAQWKVTQAQAIGLGIQRAQYEHAIAVLVGKAATDFRIPAEDLKTEPPAIPFGIPANLLERRPDIASAERSIAQANAQIGIAQAAYYPDITLSGSGGPESLSITSLPSRFWSLGPGVTETILDGGLRRASVQQSRAMYDQTVANYRQTVLSAFQEVEDNLASLRILSQSLHEQNSAVDSASRSLDEATTRYRAGLDPYLNVLTAQVVVLNARETALSLRAEQVLASVQLIRALGGGWNSSQLPEPQDLKRPEKAPPIRAAH